jgi:hypothetical protein
LKISYFTLAVAHEKVTGQKLIVQSLALLGNTLATTMQTCVQDNLVVDHFATEIVPFSAARPLCDLRLAR